MPDYRDLDFNFFSDQDEFSFAEIQQSTVSFWQDKLHEIKYVGNIPRVSEFLNELCKGMAYQYGILKERGKTQFSLSPTLILEDSPESFGVHFDHKKNAIIVPIHLIKALENLDLASNLVMRSNSDEVAFEGTVSEFWFLTGVEEITHAFDKELALRARALSTEKMTIYEYHAQKHEYKALGWQVRAIVQNQLSGKTKEFHTGLLKKVIEYRRDSQL